jgi:hypothetical protein
MRVNQALAIVAASVLALPPSAGAADPAAVLSGIVKSVTGSVLADVDLDFVNLASGATQTARTDGAGAVRLALEPGSYNVEARGYAIVRGPHTITVVEGQPSAAEFVLKGQDAAALPGGGAAVAAGGRHIGDIIALTAFSGALVGVVVRAATFKAASPSR